MKELNRREFLTLSGASVALLALAACGSTPSTPVVPTTGKETKVLEALNLYREANKWVPYKLDEGLNDLAEEGVKFALGKIELEQLYQKIAKMNVELGGLYEEPRFPLGVSEERELTMPYDDDINVMKDALLALQPADISDSIGQEKVKLVGIKVFTAKDGKLYWIATGAVSKKAT